MLLKLVYFYPQRNPSQIFFPESTKTWNLSYKIVVSFSSKFDMGIRAQVLIVISFGKIQPASEW